MASRSSPLSVLFLMSDAGGGHRAAARAIAGAFHQLYGDRVRTHIVDLMADYLPWPLNGLPKTYAPMVQYASPFHGLSWHLGTRPSVTKTLLKALDVAFTPGLERCYTRYQPDAVISVHPLMVRTPYRVLRQLGSTAPFVTVVTDLVSMFPTWFYPEVEACVVPTPFAAQAARELGVPGERVHTLGQPIDVRFRAYLQQYTLTNDRSPARARLGLRPDLPTLLVVSGGDGVGPLEEVAAAIDAQPLTAQMVIICGRNAALKRRLGERSWRLPVRVEGFVEDMPAWMAASDAIVTKAGSVTIAEALAMGLPILLFSYILGQEEGNVSYVVENGLGAYTPAPSAIAATLGEWLSGGQEVLLRLRRQCQRLARPDAALDIARIVLTAVGSRQWAVDRIPGQTAHSTQPTAH
jgi:1,2-diacylglycerol 3-beta-galactosyltransferase